MIDIGQVRFLCRPPNRSGRTRKYARLGVIEAGPRPPAIAVRKGDADAPRNTRPKKIAMTTGAALGLIHTSGTPLAGPAGDRSAEEAAAARRRVIGR